MSYPNDQAIQRAFTAELINDASIDCVLTLDTDLKITSWNKMCETLSGRNKEAVLGKRLENIHPEIAASKEFANAFRHALLGRKSFIPADKGSMKGEYTETHVVPMKNVLEQVVGVLIIRHDVAHRQYAEQELKRLNKLLAQQNRELEARNAELIAFSRITSHDLKEPIRKIRIFTNMFIEREQARLSEEGASLFSRILKSANRAEGLTDDIYTFSHLQNTTEPVADIDLKLPLKMAIHQLQQIIEESGATIDYGELPPISGRNQLLQQLFKGILENGLKFGARGARPNIKIQSGQASATAALHKDAVPDAAYTWLSFTDDGIGFDAQYRELIFEMFQRLHKQHEYSGNGIGLSLCRKIMEIHGGFITAESEPGKGSVFTCYFPVS